MRCHMTCHMSAVTTIPTVTYGVSQKAEEGGHRGFEVDISTFVTRFKSQVPSPNFMVFSFHKIFKMGHSHRGRTFSELEHVAHAVPWLLHPFLTVNRVFLFFFP